MQEYGGIEAGGFDFAEGSAGSGQEVPTVQDVQQMREEQEKTQVPLEIRLVEELGDALQQNDTRLAELFEDYLGNDTREFLDKNLGMMGDGVADALNLLIKSAQLSYDLAAAGDTQAFSTLRKRLTEIKQHLKSYVDTHHRTKDAASATFDLRSW